MVRLTRRARPDGDGPRASHLDERQLRQFQAFKAELTGRKGEMAVARAVAALGLPALHDIILPDATGLTQIDHLVLGDAALLVIETKTYGGIITGLPTDAEWHQHLNEGSVRTAFLNPLRQNYRHCQAVERLARSIGSVAAIEGHVVSAGRATFADELRGSVTGLAAIADLCLRKSAGPAEANDLRRVWTYVAGVAERHEGRRVEHRASLVERSEG